MARARRKEEAAWERRRAVGGGGAAVARGKGARGDEEGWTGASRETMADAMEMAIVAITNIQTMAGLSQNDYGISQLNLH